MADATMLERIGTALTRAEVAAARMKAERDSAVAKAALLDAASAKAITALDALIAR